MSTTPYSGRLQLTKAGRPTCSSSRVNLQLSPKCRPGGRSLARIELSLTATPLSCSFARETTRRIVPHIRVPCENFQFPPVRRDFARPATPVDSPGPHCIEPHASRAPHLSEHQLRPLRILIGHRRPILWMTLDTRRMRRFCW